MKEKILRKGNYELRHIRYQDSFGFLCDGFEVAKIKDDGSRLIKPFLPPIKITNYESDDNIMDRTSDYTDAEYEILLQENSNF